MSLSIGAFLIIVGAILLILEVEAPGFFIGLPGSVLIGFGILAVIAPGILSSMWSPVIVVILLIIMTKVFMTFYSRLAPPDSPPEMITGSSLAGKQGIVTKDIRPDSIDGKVEVFGESWSATADDYIPSGTRVKIKVVEGVHLNVEPVETINKNEETKTE